jgi:hypothetical protein
MLSPHEALGAIRLLGECTTCRCARFGQTDTAQAERLEEMAKALATTQQRVRTLTEANEVQRIELDRTRRLFDEGVAVRAKQERDGKKREKERQKEVEEEEIKMFGLRHEVREVVEQAMHWQNGRSPCEWLKQALAIAYQLGEIEIELDEFSLTALVRAGFLEVGDRLQNKGNEMGEICVSGEETSSLVALISNHSGFYRSPEEWLVAHSNKRVAKNRIEKQLREILVYRRDMVIGSLHSIWQGALQTKDSFRDSCDRSLLTVRGLQFDAISLQRLGAAAVAPVRSIVAGCANWTAESAPIIARAVTELLAAWAKSMQLLTTVAQLEKGK